MGLSESAAEFFPDAAWQRCIVHWYRNVFSHVPSTKVREAAAMLKAIHAGEDIAAARQKAVQVIEKLGGLRLTTAAQLVEGAVEETLAYYAFPEDIGGASAPTIRWSAFCARSGGAPAWSAHSRTGNRPSIWLRPGCATSLGPHGRPNAT